MRLIVKLYCIPVPYIVFLTVDHSWTKMSLLQSWLHLQPIESVELVTFGGFSWKNKSAWFVIHDSHVNIQN